MTMAVSSYVDKIGGAPCGVMTFRKPDCALGTVRPARDEDQFYSSGREAQEIADVEIVQNQ